MKHQDRESNTSNQTWMIILLFVCAIIAAGLCFVDRVQINALMPIKESVADWYRSHNIFLMYEKIANIFHEQTPPPVADKALAEKEAVHFEFYSTLPNMAMAAPEKKPAEDVVIASSEKIVQPEEKPTPVAFEAFKSDELENDISQYLNK